MRDVSHPHLSLLPASYVPTGLPIVIACLDTVLGTVIFVVAADEPSNGMVSCVFMVGVGPPLLAAGVLVGGC